MSTEGPASRSVALVMLRRGEHVLFGGLLVLGAAGAWGGPYGAALSVGAVLVAGWYGAGIALARRTRRRAAALVWLLVLTLGCAGLVLGSAAFVWLAFPLFLLYAQLLPLPAALPAVAVLTAGTIAAIAADRGRLDPATVVGPLVGAAVAVMMTVVYRDLLDQVRARAGLVEELTAAQDRLATSQRQAGMLAERERLARELHDTVTQSLTGLVMVLRGIRDDEAQRDEARRDEARRDEGRRDEARLDAAIAAARSALQDTRGLLRALAPSELVGRSLPEALRRALPEAPGLETRLRIEGEPYTLATPAAVTLLRSAQEAMANAGTHAAARQVTVTLTYLPESVSLDVVDDGMGFDPGAPLSPSTGTGLGLTGIRARAAEVGGTAEVDSAPGQGTAVNVTVPRASRLTPENRAAHDG